MVYDEIKAARVDGVQLLRVKRSAKRIGARRYVAKKGCPGVEFARLPSGM